jgi:hypothetical protein
MASKSNLGGEMLRCSLLLFIGLELVSLSSAFSPNSPGNGAIKFSHRIPTLASNIRKRGFKIANPVASRVNSRLSFIMSSKQPPSEQKSTEIPLEDCGCGDAVPIGDLRGNLVKKIEAAAAMIRKMKDDGVKDKAVLQPHIDELLSLKTQFQAVTGEPYDPPKKGSTPAKAAKPARSDTGEETIKIRGEQAVCRSTETPPSVVFGDIHRLLIRFHGGRRASSSPRGARTTPSGTKT